nr:unnamed protein product [Callosobruchus analis]
MISDRLLDSGATRTVLGGPGWSEIKPLFSLTKTSDKYCTVANGQSCEVLGEIPLPIQLRDRVRIIKALVIPSLPHRLILGIDLWVQMGIVPDMKHGEWTFQTEESIQSIQVCGIQDMHSLNEHQQAELNQVIEDAFEKMGNRLGCTHLVEHVIKTTSLPIKQRYYPLSPALQKVVNAELDDMLEKGIVEPSSSAWSSPIVMVQKKDKSWRFCVNFKRLNAVSSPDAYPLPFISSILDKLRDAKYISSLDIKSAFHQIKLSEESKPLTAFTVPTRGLFQFTRMPFGLHSAPATWQRLIDKVLGADLDNHTFVYLDDIIICTPSFEKHIEVLRNVLKRIVDAGLVLNREKSQFCRSELRYLGYVVNGSGLLVDPSKVEAILRMEPPKNVTEVRRIIGLASWYRRFVPSFSMVVAPLTRLTEKNRPFV